MAASTVSLDGELPGCWVEILSYLMLDGLEEA